MFLWKRVLVQDAFFILIEESNIIIPPLISLAAYPCNPEGNPLWWGYLSALVFIIYNYKAMSTEEYVNHQLNASKTKEAHQFSKANRFPKSSKTYPHSHQEQQKSYTPSPLPPPSAPLHSATDPRSTLPIRPYRLLRAVTMRLAISRREISIIRPVFMRAGKKLPSDPSFWRHWREIRRCLVPISTTSQISTSQ